MLKIYRTCNSTVEFSKYEFNNKLLSSVILFRVILNVTLSLSLSLYIYIYIYITYVFCGAQTHNSPSATFNHYTLRSRFP